MQSSPEVADMCFREGGQPGWHCAFSLMQALAALLQLSPPPASLPQSCCSCLSCCHCCCQVLACRCLHPVGEPWGASWRCCCQSSSWHWLPLSSAALAARVSRSKPMSAAGSRLSPSQGKLTGLAPSAVATTAWHAVHAGLLLRRQILSSRLWWTPAATNSSGRCRHDCAQPLSVQPAEACTPHVQRGLLTVPVLSSLPVAIAATRCCCCCCRHCCCWPVVQTAIGAPNPVWICPICTHSTVSHILDRFARSPVSSRL